MTEIKKWHISGFLFCLIIGFLLHYTYEFSGDAKLVGYFSAVNESVWEHLKLIFFPFAVWMMAEYIAYGKAEIDFFAVKITAVLAAMGFIVAFYYTYTGILGFNLLAFDVFLYVAGVCVGQIVSFRLMSANMRGDYSDNIKGILTFMLIGLCFVVWTDSPPDLGIFWG